MTTFLVTGATGYIAKHIVRHLLDDGYDVVGSTRDTARDSEVRAAVGPGLPDGALDRYRTVALDLTRDDGWDAAMEGVDVLIHTASPFPMTQPKDPEDLIRPAVDGVRRALSAAQRAGIGKAVLTSSTVAIAGSVSDGQVVSEDDWTDVDAKGLNAYSKSKTLAEREAWRFIEEEAPEMRLTAINPGLVVGPALDTRYGTSLEMIERLVRSKDPMLPDFGVLCCDVRDVAEAHVVAATSEEGEGKRHMIAERFITFPAIAQVIDKALPDRKITTRVAPNFVVKALGLVDPTVRSIVPDLGKRMEPNNARARTVLGRDLADSRDAIAETARFLVRSGAVA